MVFEKLSKTKNVEIEIENQITGHIKSKIVSVMVEPLRRVKEGTQKEINKIPGTASI